MTPKRITLASKQTLRAALLPLLLGVLTLFALLPWEPQGPFDARDWSPLAGARVTLPWQGAVLEPFAALSHILTGAPDFRIAALSFALWTALLSGGWVFVRRRDLGGWRRGLWAGAVAAFGFWCIPASLLFYSHLHLPGWQLQLDDPQWLAADLQSHTLGSHDGLVSGAYNLLWHERRGYDVVAVTEHDETAGSFYAEALGDAAGRLTVLPGIEVANEYGGFLLGVGMREGVPTPERWHKGEADYSRRFSQEIAQQHQGAVISLAWRLGAEDVEALVDDGVDAFELTNQGHPDIPDSVRDEMLRLERAGRIRLVSSTDWHGWGGAARTWTLLHLPGAAAMTPQARKAAIITLLREGSREAVIPVTAAYQGPPGVWRTVLAPLTETLRYAAELSPLRLLSWWLWGALFWLLARRLRRAGYPAPRLLGGGALLLVGGGLVWGGVRLYRSRADGGVMLSVVTGDLGVMALQAALPLLLVGGWLVWRTLRQRQKPNRHH
jgi:hypothetical protein